MKTTFILALVILLTEISIAQTADNKLKENREVQNLTIIGVGDIMLGTSYPGPEFLPSNNDCQPLLRDVKSVLQSADITFGNLEGCFSDNAPRAKYCKDTSICYAFRMPEKYAQCIKDAGFDMLSLANNHSGDFGDAARNTTVQLLDSLNIYHAGWVKYPTALFTKDSVTYGFAAFAPNSNTVDLNDLPNAIALVAELKSKADIVIVSFHGGAEGSDHMHVTRKTETFYGENRGNVYEFTHALIDAGADIIFGHGPHVPRAIELYKNRIIAYSLGNYCTYSKVNVQGANGLAPMLKVIIDNQGNFIEGQIISGYQPYRSGTFMDANHKAALLIRDLSKADFPESPIKIDDIGNITRIAIE